MTFFKTKTNDSILDALRDAEKEGILSSHPLMDVDVHKADHAHEWHTELNLFNRDDSLGKDPVVDMFRIESFGPSSNPSSYRSSSLNMRSGYSGY